MSSTNSPCAACKFLRRKCTQECVFAPYFSPDQPQKFANVHKVFGASNVSKILNELNTTQREDTVNSLAYEADARLRDPVYECVGLISVLQHRLKQVQKDLHEAKIELASYIGPNVLPVLNQGFIPQIHSMPSSSVPYNMQPAMGIAAPTNVYQQQQEMVTFVNSIEQQEMLRNYEQQQQQPVDIVRNVMGSGFNPMTAPATTSPSLSLGSTYVNDMCHIPQGQDQNPQLQHGHHFLLQQETTQQQQMLRNYEQQQQQPVDIVRNVTGSGFNPMTAPATTSPSLSLGSTYVNDMCHIPQGQDQNPQLQHGHHFLLQQETTQQPAVLCVPPAVAQRTTGEEDRSVAPSC